MKLTNRKALTVNNKECTIITEPVLSSKDKYMVLTVQDDRFVPQNVADLTLIR